MRSTQPSRLSSQSLSYYLCIYRNDFREEVDKRQICNSQRFLFLFWRGSAKQGTKYIYMYTLFSFLSFFLSFFFFLYSLLLILSFQQHCCLSISCSSLYVIYKVFGPSFVSISVFSQYISSSSGLSLIYL